MREIKTENLRSEIPGLHAGDRIALTGSVYTARDAAHARLVSLIDEGLLLPFKLDGAIIYYTGPTPAREGMAVGSCGPTTSGRMDRFTPPLLDRGLLAVIGKGERNEEVCRSIADNGAVYFCAIGGAGALMARHVKASEEIAFPELGCESVKRLTVEQLPLTVGVDSHGGNIFKNARRLADG